MILKRIKTKLTEEQGVSIVLVAVMLLVLLGLGAMALDTGQILWTRGTLQNAVDAAALAGVRELPQTTLADCAYAQQVAEDYLAANYPDPNVDVQVSFQQYFDQNSWETRYYNAITVTATKTDTGGLRKAVGAGDTDVPASAMAVVAKVNPSCDLWPFGIEESVMLYDDPHGAPIRFDESYGQKVILKVPDNTDVAPGNFLALDFGNGANAYIDSIKFKGCLPEGQVQTKTGNMNGPTRDGVLRDGNSAITQCVPDFVWDPNNLQAPDCVEWHNTAIGYPYSLGCPGSPSQCGLCTVPTAAEPHPMVKVPSCSRVGIIPILQGGTFSDYNSAAHGTIDVTIVNYAAFYLIGLEPADHGNQYYVVGSFLRTVNVVGGTPNPNSPPEGPVGYFLWK